MPAYDFKSLSPQDFEELSRDLLQAQWKVPLEAFKLGRDQGIDLRYAPAGDGTTIIQCKHKVGSGMSALLYHLKQEEFPKIVRLNPKRYVLVTSVPMNPNDKDNVVQALSPYVLSTVDIVAADDLNGLLRMHKNVEQANFKLWLTSTAVLERVLHNAEKCTTEFHVENIRRKLPLFVQTKALTRADEMLETQRVLVVSGAPGIGKTTLAEMLLFAHVERGFEPVVMQSDLAEGKKFFRPANRQIFYYDDFLGQSFLGDTRMSASHNQDLALANFVEMVRKTESSRFVLTTREHILQQAFLGSERLAHSNVLNNRYVLKLSDYAFAHRARILYNHLYFSELPAVYKEALLADDFFLKIIKHPHFNPRLIEWLSSLERLGLPRAADYQQRVSRLLDSPHEIWAHAFKNQLSNSGRDLLLALYSLGELSEVAELEPAFESIHRGHSQAYNRIFGPTDFRDALKELDGGFVTYQNALARFLNPSVKDYMADVICNTPKIALDLLNLAVRFKQMVAIWRLARERKDSPLLAAIAQGDRLVSAAKRLLSISPTKWIGHIGYNVDTDEEDRFVALVEFSEVLRSQPFAALCTSYAQILLTHWQTRQIDFRSATHALEAIRESDWLWSNGGDKLWRQVLDGVISNLSQADADDWYWLYDMPNSIDGWTSADDSQLKEAFAIYSERGVKNERRNCTGVDELSSLRVSLTDLSKQSSVPFDDEIAAIDREIAELEEEEPQSEPAYERRSLSAESTSDEAALMTEDDVRQMFANLR